MKSFAFKAIGCLIVSACLLQLITGASPETRDTTIASSRIDEADEEWVSEILRTLTLRDKIAQLIQIRVPGKFINRQNPEFQQIAELISKYHIGGVALFAGNVYDSAVLLNELQQISKLPLLVASDFERGASFRIANTTSFPWTMAIGATGSEEFAYQQGAITAQEARALGVHWIFAPVMDVNSNPENPVINIRALGEDPELVARLGAAFIRGARDMGVLTTAKHFPGHGDTVTDSHVGLPVVSSDMARLQSLELIPFISAIDAGVDSIMTAHVAVPKITGNPRTPATLSSTILTDMLRNSLQFQGLIVTDSLEMAGATKSYWSGLAAVRTIQAGADVLLLPPDAVVAINTIEHAVKHGDISENRIDVSVERILRAKSSLGLHRRRTVPIERISEIVASPQNQKLAQDIADHSITLLRDNQHLLPLNPIRAPRIFSLIIASGLESSPGDVFQAEMHQRFPSLYTEWIDARASDEIVAEIENYAAKADVIVFSTLVRLISGKRNLTFSEKQRRVIDKLIASGKPLIWVAFGSPYVLELYPQIGTYLCTFSYSDVSQIAAAKALCGEIAVGGKMPVSIPQYARIGDGLQLKKLDMTLKPKAALDFPRNPFMETRQLLATYLDNGASSRAKLVVGYQGALILDLALGGQENLANSKKSEDFTVHGHSSLLDVMGPTAATMLLVESGRLLLNTPVREYLPEFQGPGKERVRVYDLLIHSSGLPAFLPSYEDALSYEQTLEMVCTTPLTYEPGAKSEHSDLGMILLGEIVSRTTGIPLDRFLAIHLFIPLGKSSSFPSSASAMQEQIAATENEAWYEQKENGKSKNTTTSFPAYEIGQSMFPNAYDLALFAQMLLNEGIYDHRRYFNPATIALFTASQQLPGGAQGLGWNLASKSNWMGNLFSPVSFGYTDSSGASFLWIDPAIQLFVVLFTDSKPSMLDQARVAELQESIAKSVLRATRSLGDSSLQ